MTCDEQKTIKDTKWGGLDEDKDKEKLAQVQNAYTKDTSAITVVAVKYVGSKFSHMITECWQTARYRV